MHSRIKQTYKPVIKAKNKSAEQQVRQRYIGMFAQKEYKSRAKVLNNFNAQLSYKHLFVLFLVTSPYFMQLIKASHPGKFDFNNLGMKNITGVPCQKKTKGISDGKTCHVNGDTYYLKPYSMYSVQNKKFLKDNVGVKTPETKLFYEKQNHGVYSYYVAAKEILDLKLASSFKISEQSLGDLGVAKLAVAASFIDDLHPDNWGVDNSGLVLIDVDAKNNAPQTLDDYVEMARKALNKDSMPAFSLRNLEEMLGIYSRMREQSLSKLPQEFYLSHELYLQVLDLYIKACHGAIDKIKHQNPGLDENQTSHSINQVLVNRMYAQQQRINFRRR